MNNIPNIAPKPTSKQIPLTPEGLAEFSREIKDLASRLAIPLCTSTVTQRLNFEDLQISKKSFGPNDPKPSAETPTTKDIAFSTKIPLEQYQDFLRKLRTSAEDSTPLHRITCLQLKAQYPKKSE